MCDPLWVGLRRVSVTQDRLAWVAVVVFVFGNAPHYERRQSAPVRLQATASTCRVSPQDVVVMNVFKIVVLSAG